MRSHIGRRGKRNILCNGVETLKPGRERPKRTVSVSGGLEPLQIVSELDIGRCVSEDTEP